MFFFVLLFKKTVMEKIDNKQQFDEAVKRVEALLPLISDDMPTDDPNYIEFVRLSNMVADYDEIHYSVFRNFDEILDAEYGKEGTPEREQFNKEVETYRQAIEDVDKKLGLEKLETKEQHQWAISRIEELRSLINSDTPCYDHNCVEKELLSFMIMDYEEEHLEPNEETKLAIEEAMRGEGKPVDLSSMEAFLKSMEEPNDQ